MNRPTCQPDQGEPNARPTYRKIMERIALDSLNSGTAFFAVAWLLFVGLIAFAIYRLVVPA